MQKKIIKEKVEKEKAVKPVEPVQVVSKNEPVMIRAVVPENIEEEGFYFFVNEPHCLGFEEDTEKKREESFEHKTTVSGFR